MEHKYTNKLINEKSPYLLQHAHNPVNWYSWSKEAFAKALEEDKPIFLSIGYSTCHWCHVMESESFEDVEVSNILNDIFISIKVDREERPDIDSIYMKVCQMITGSGGWPLTIFMSPDQHPFFAGTYFPKQSSYNRVGLIDLLNLISSLWKKDRDKLIESSEYILDSLKYHKIESGEINNNTLNMAFKFLSSNYDEEFGGFEYAPKFPMPTYLLFLIRYYYSTNKKDALSMLVKTLQSIYRGGIYDHIGFGISRYSTDNKWLVPHFEKMLYDNALLLMTYTESYQITRNDLFKKIASDICTYIERDMTSKEGGFYSAQDADSEGTEGKFYVWGYDEIINVLGKEDGKKFCKQYNVTNEGNFESKNILNLIDSDNLSMDEEIRKKLFNYRDKRAHPYKDDKILASWNGLMIAALSIAGRVFKSNEYIDKSKMAVDFIYEKLFNKEGRLLARYREGEASIFAYSDDYVFLIWGLIELYEATFDSTYLKKAIELNEQLIKYFWDEVNGGLFLFGEDGEQLISRPKEIYDGVIPSANSVSTINFLRLNRLTGNKLFQELADKQFRTFGSQINSNPTGCTYMLSSYLFSISKTMEVVIVGDKDNAKEMFDIVNDNYNPFMTILFKDINDDCLTTLMPFLSDYKMIDDKPTAYICTNNICSKPINDIDEFKSMMKLK